MDLETIRYSEYEKNLPQDGQHIVGYEIGDDMIVYQAYKRSIAEFSVQNQYLGGEFSLNRMSWIKPGFLWMMYRSGWASKENQESVLAIRIKKSHFNEIIQSAVHTSYKEGEYESTEIWKEKLNGSEARIQWDPDHDPHGNKLKRKAIQLGLKGSLLEKYSKEWIISIQDISAFVAEQKQVLEQNNTKLEVVKESVINVGGST